MLPLYFGGLLFGGVLLGASFFGGDGHGGDHDADHDGHLDHHDHDVRRALPFFSLRFWAFAFGFFGLAGLALTGVGGAGLLTPVLAGAVGLGCGYASDRVIKSLARHPVGLLGDAAAHVGREGRVLLPIGPGRRGKIRLQIGGTSTDLVAETESEALLVAGDTALLVGIRGNVALVERNPAAPRSLAAPDRGRDS